MRLMHWALTGVLLAPLHAWADSSALSPQQQLTRSIYEELININTTHSNGSTTKAAAAVAKRLKAAGFAPGEILQFSGGEAEKFARGRPSFAAFDLVGWVGMADALGLSLYTNSGYPDMGHGSIEATVNLVSVARLLGKDVFVLEGGNEAPNVTLDPAEFRYFGTVARRLDPRTYIYEFLKEKFLEDYKSNPGKIVTAQGRIRKPAFQAMRTMFQEIESTDSSPVKPVLYVYPDAMAARGNERIGLLHAALYDLAATLPIIWIPAGSTPRRSAPRSGSGWSALAPSSRWHTCRPSGNSRTSRSGRSATGRARHRAAWQGRPPRA